MIHDIYAIRPQMMVEAADGEEIGVVDSLDAQNTIKLRRDGAGAQHWLPPEMVARVDDRVHLAARAAQVRLEWMDTPPARE